MSAPTLPAAETPTRYEDRQPSLPWYAPLAVFVLAFVLRATMAVRTSVIFEDGPFFIQIAKQLAAGEWGSAFAHPYHPLYSGLIALTQTVTGSFETAALVVSVSGGTAAVAALYVFLREAFDRNAAIFGALLFAISPYAVRFTSDVQSEGVYLACFTTSLVFLWRGLEGVDEAEWLQLFGAGLCAGAAYLARPEGVGLIVVGLLLLARKMWSGRIAFLKAVTGGLSLCLAGVLFAAPYLATLAASRGGLVLTGKKSVARMLGLSEEPLSAIANGLAAVPLFIFAFMSVGAILTYWVMRSRKLGRAGAARKNAIPLAAGLIFLFVWYSLWPAELREFTRVMISTLRPEVALLVAIGVFVPSLKKSSQRDAFILIIMLCYGAVLVGLLFNYGYLSRRHALPLVPLALGYAGVGAVWIVKKISQLRSSAPSALPAAALAMLLIAVALPKALHNHREDVLAQRVAAEWLRDASLGPGLLASNKRRAAFYAERSWSPLTDGSELHSLRLMAKRGVRYIVVDEHILAGEVGLPVSPGFGLNELQRVTTGGHTAVLYEIDRSASADRPDVTAASSEHKTH